MSDLTDTGDQIYDLQNEIERLTAERNAAEIIANDLYARIKTLEGALREIALDTDNPTNQRTWAAERADKALAAAAQEGEGE